MELDKNTEIQRWLDRLDETAIKFEAKWGIGFLQTSATPDLKTRWDRQREKLTQAVQAKNVPLVSELVEGTIRAWSALEANVVAQGIVPRNIDAWEVQLEDGFRLRVVKTGTEARGVASDGCAVWSLPEIARVIQKQYTLVNVVKDKFPGAVVKDIKSPIDWKEGDAMPF